MTKHKAMEIYQREKARMMIARLYLICHTQQQPSIEDAMRFAGKVLTLGCVQVKS